MSEQTLDRCCDLRSEVLSYIEIALDSQKLSQVYINFPKFNMNRVKRQLKHINEKAVQILKRSALVELELLEPHLEQIIVPLFN